MQRGFKISTSEVQQGLNEMVSVKLLVQRLPQGERLAECDGITTIILILKKRNPGVEPFIKENVELTQKPQRSLHTSILGIDSLSMFPDR